MFSMSRTKFEYDENDSENVIWEIEHIFVLLFIVDYYG